MRILKTKSWLLKLIIIALLIKFSIMQPLYSQERVSVPTGKPIMVDGTFSEQEWNDAKMITISDEVKLYFKKSEEYVYIGIQPPSEGYNGGWIDLYIAGNDGEILDLHASRKLGERNLIDGDWKEWKDWWTNEGTWRANYTRLDDIEENGEKKVIQLKDEGWEYQIKKSKFKNDKWKIMFDIFLFNGVKKLKFPKESVNTKSDNWLTLEL